MTFSVASPDAMLVLFYYAPADSNVEDWVGYRNLTEAAGWEDGTVRPRAHKPTAGVV